MNVANRRIYGIPQIPYERVIASLHVEDEVKAALVKEHQVLDPVMLKIQTEQKLKKYFSPGDDYLQHVKHNFR